MSINERILAAMASGARTIPAVIADTGLPRTQVKNAVMRLKHYQRIKRVRRYPSEYVVRGKVCRSTKI